MFRVHTGSVMYVHAGALAFSTAATTLSIVTVNSASASEIDVKLLPRGQNILIVSDVCDELLYSTGPLTISQSGGVASTMKRNAVDALLEIPA